MQPHSNRMAASINRYFFHSRKNLKKGLKKAPAREERELPKQEGYAPSSTFCVTGVSQSATVTDTAHS